MDVVEWEVQGMAKLARKYGTAPKELYFWLFSTEKMERR